MKQSTQFKMSQSIAPTGVSNPPEFPLPLVKFSALNPENTTPPDQMGKKITHFCLPSI